MKIRCEVEGMTILAQISPRRRNSSLFALYPVPLSLSHSSDK